MHMQPAGDGAKQDPQQISFRELLGNALRFWETGRLFYNLALLAVVVCWLALTWPHFRNALTMSSLSLMVVLALLANGLYCAAYLVDLPLERSRFAGAWRHRRWILWVVGTLVAIVLANYWIVDEIYPFVP